MLALSVFFRVAKVEVEGNERYTDEEIVDASGIFDEGKLNIIGNGCVIAPDLFMAEAKELEAAGYDLRSRLHIMLILS